MESLHDMIYTIKETSWWEEDYNWYPNANLLKNMPIKHNGSDIAKKWWDDNDVWFVLDQHP
jgi:hypothetical protein